ncbi:MAG: AbrB/MazE/SpoVT family DNA-binding domain-containing protein [Pseudomonadota bacterium]
MSDRIKVRKVGNSLGVVIPADALKRHKVGEGDELLLTLTPNGYSLAVYDQDVVDQVKAGREIASKYKNTLRELAK